VLDTKGLEVLGQVGVPALLLFCVFFFEAIVIVLVIASDVAFISNVVFHLLVFAFIPFFQLPELLHFKHFAFCDLLRFIEDPVVR